MSGSPKSPIMFNFNVDKAGLYYLHLYGARDMTHGQRKDYSNDCYVRAEGDYAEGPKAGKKHGGDANKFSWASGNRLDLGGHNNRRVAVYNFKTGKTYTLVISGHSQYFSIDRTVFRHTDVKPKEAQDLSKAESKRK